MNRSTHPRTLAATAAIRALVAVTDTAERAASGQTCSARLVFPA